MSPRLSIIPAPAVTDDRLEPRDLQVLCLLGRHTEKRSGWCRRSQVKMAVEISCGRATLGRSIERLVDAGYVQKRQWNVPDGEEPGRPSASYEYRVVLDFEAPAIARDDDGDDTESHDSRNGAASLTYAPDASETGEGVPTGGHPPARPDGHPVPTYARAPRTNLSNDQIERDARASHDETAKFIVAFEARWPTIVADNANRIAYAAGELTRAEQDAALAGIGPFLEELKRLKRKHPPAGFTYLEEKRWTKLPPAPAAPVTKALEEDSAEGRAVAVLHAIAGKSQYFRDVVKRGDKVFYRGPIDARLTAIGQAPGEARWVVLTRQQAAAWEDVLHRYVTVQNRQRLSESARAPWPWPPSVEGKLYVDGDAPTVPEMTDDDVQALANERVR